LEDGHLGGRVLHGDAVGAEAEVGLAADDVLAGGVVEVAVDDLGERKGKWREGR
jgi:hypothetical protein